MAHPASDSDRADFLAAIDGLEVYQRVVFEPRALVCEETRLCVSAKEARGLVSRAPMFAQVEVYRPEPSKFLVRIKRPLAALPP